MSSETAEVPVKRPQFGGTKKGQKYNKVPAMLKDMRWAYQNADREVVRNSSPQRERFREMCKSSPDKFFDRLQQMEREHKPAKKQEQKPADPSVPPPPAEKDVGSEEALGLIERWLKEWQVAQPPPG